jgi:uncharacterized membrane protein YbaN (DUF454 family)
MKRTLFVVAGTIALGIGVVGIFVPVLPTTPFLLLAAACYMRGSRRLYDALLHNRFFGKYIRNYLEGRGMSVKAKIWTLLPLWVVMVCTVVWGTDNPWVRAILALVLAGVTVHILRVKTATSNVWPSSQGTVK